MPFVASSSHLQNDQGRPKRFILPLLLKSVFGTIHGIYSHLQYQRLRQDINGVIKEQGRTIDLIRTNAINIVNFSQVQSELIDILSNTNMVTASRMVVLLQKFQQELNLEVYRIFDAVQTAQHR